MQYIIIFLLTYAIIFNIKADDDFGDYEDNKPSRNVVLRESAFSQKVSILTTKGFFITYRYALRPILVSYREVTTLNFRLSVSDGFVNIYNLGSTVYNLFVGSPQRFAGSLGYVISNISIGFGTLDASKEFNLSNYNTSFTDVLRFYYFPEGYFFLIAGFPITFTTLGDLAFESIVKTRYYNISGGFFIDFLGKQLNAVSLNIEVLDILAKSDPILLYSSARDYIYSSVKYFNIERNPFATKQQALKIYLDYKDGKLF